MFPPWSVPDHVVIAPVLVFVPVGLTPPVALRLQEAYLCNMRASGEKSSA
jgi:hypothetical protein